MARRALSPDQATNEGSRLLRALLKKHTFGALARRLLCDERTVRWWAHETWKPSLLMRDRIETTLGIRAAAWDEEPSDDAYAVDPATTRRQ